MWKNIAIATAVVAVLIGSAAAVVTLDNAPAAEQTQQRLGQAGLGGQGGAGNAGERGSGQGGQGKGDSNAGDRDQTGQGQGKGGQGSPGGGQGGGNAGAGDCDQAGKAGQGQQGKNGGGGPGGSQFMQGEGTLVSAEDWVTVEGTITQVDTNAIVIQTAAGDTLTVKVGPPHFVEGLGVEFQPGDEISVLGFYEDGEFEAAQITFLATGEQITLRDKNGRPLWTGGRSSAGGGTDGGKGGQGGYKGGR
jgi:hypothetical protein